ncbi:MAG: hypothetical protein ABS949_10370 [Solibacillus sp.]
MDWMLVLFLSFLVICVLLIVITLVSLPRMGDERKNFIKMKAQSYSFICIIGLLLFEIIEATYLAFWTDRSYEGMNPFSVLVTISIVYLITLLFSKKKYGG